MPTSRNSWGPGLRRLVRSAARDCRAAARQCRGQLAPRSVHWLRVALRRFEARLLIVEGLVGRGAATRARKAVRKRLAAFGGLRDAQVHGERLAELAGNRAGLGRLRAHWHRRELRERRRAALALRTRKFDRRVRQLLEVLRDLPADAGTDRNLSLRARRMLRRLRTRALDRLPRAARDMTRLHRARIAFKRYHLAAEALQPFLPEVDAAQLAAYKDYHRLMGEIHDLDLLLGQLDRAVAEGRASADAVRAPRAALRRRRTARVRRYLRLTRKIVGAVPGSRSPDRPA